MAMMNMTHHHHLGRAAVSLPQPKQSSSHQVSPLRHRRRLRLRHMPVMSSMNQVGRVSSWSVSRVPSRAANRFAVSWKPSRHLIDVAVAAAHPEDSSPAAHHQEAGTELISKAADLGADSTEPTLFAEPLLRCFLLGVGSAVLVETLHTAAEYMQTMDEGIVQNIFQHMAASGFRPAFFLDHTVAAGAAVIFYVMEAVAMIPVLKNYGPEDAEATKAALNELSTLPRRMFPYRLHNIVRWIFLITASGPIAAMDAISHASGPSSAASSAAPLDPVRFQDAESPAVIVNKWAEAETAAAVAGTSTPSSPREKLEEIFTKGPGAGRKGIAEPLPERRQKELNDRKAYLRNFWYAAAVASDVKAGEPKGVEILGMKLVLFRDPLDGNRVKAINDICPHRAAPLSSGWVESKEGHTCVVCPYHGWAFDGEGKLHDVPAADQGESWPRRPLVPSYDVEERGGFVWLFYGSRDLPKDERPPIPMMPELEDPNWHPVFGEFEFKAPHWTVFQNAIDMAHIHYLHSDSFGNQEAPDIRGVKEIEHDAWGVTSTFKLTNKPVNALWSFTAVPEVEVTAKALLPSTSVISFTLGAGVSFITFVSTVPIDEHRSVNRFALIRNKFSFGGFDSMAVDAMRKIFSEDKAMIEQLRPELLPREVSVRADTIQTLHAKLRQEYIDLGYGVFPDSSSSSSCGTDDC